ncbi:hypothetical protein GQ43DRAFT_377161 [Delitschia confertaspora ATCC 74209]|uniref:F-box domain-containing protein n=1 Tax=Delitschia confertaspora ATCC 74209 TaxID=1513339 RepID=A0A9P4MQ76_9PLEO|nr:hypothetical protein GQ43DRAFT_377161 [Delitschia confertaspora ATCC 74209]
MIRIPDLANISLIPVAKRLPREVYDCILDQLAEIHLGRDEPCPDCYLKDMYNLALTSRRWDCAVKEHMYRKIWLTTNEDNFSTPKLRIKGTTRLKLFRRTLRERPTLARLVRELHMSQFQSLYNNAAIDKKEIVDLVASIVMACPNLKRLHSFHIPYTHTFDRLSHALSTRRNLKERVWLLSENTEDEEQEGDDDLSNIYYHTATDPTEQFLDLNSNYSSLDTLVLHQSPTRSSTGLSFRALIGTLKQLPCLRHLSISNFPAASFTNLTLNSLPANLQSLRLERLPGVTEGGLQRFAKSALTDSIQSLTLIDLGASNILTLSQFLSSKLGSLVKFTFVQWETPTLPIGASVPIFQSSTLTYLHWEVGSQAISTVYSAYHTLSGHSDPRSRSHLLSSSGTERVPCLATSILASSIQSNYFPSLTKLRAPHDPQGLLQSVCKPRVSALLPSDKLFVSPLISCPFVAGPSRGLVSQVDLSNLFGGFSCREFTGVSTGTVDPRTLPISIQSRLAAHSRILDRRKLPCMYIKVEDPDGCLVDIHSIYGFMGRLESRVKYEVMPDQKRGCLGCEEGRNGGESEWVTGIGGLTGDSEDFEGEEAILGRCGHVNRRHREDVGAMDLF